MKEYSFKEVIANIKDGEEYELKERGYRLRKIFCKNGLIEFVSTDDPVRVTNDERYIKVAKAVSLNDVLITPDKKVLIEHEMLSCSFYDDYNYLASILKNLSEDFSSEDIKIILREAKYYLES